MRQINLCILIQDSYIIFLILILIQDFHIKCGIHQLCLRPSPIMFYHSTLIVSSSSKLYDPIHYHLFYTLKTPNQIYTIFHSKQCKKSRTTNLHACLSMMVQWQGGGDFACLCVHLLILMWMDTGWLDTLFIHNQANRNQMWRAAGYQLENLSRIVMTTVKQAAWNNDELWMWCVCTGISDVVWM